MRGNAVVALVADAYGNVNQLFHQRIERAITHDLFSVLPGTLQANGIMREGLPEVGDFVDFACGLDVVINGADFRRGIFVFNETECGHKTPSWCDDFTKKWRVLRRGMPRLNFVIFCERGTSSKTVGIPRCARDKEKVTKALHYQDQLAGC